MEKKDEIKKKNENDYGNLSVVLDSKKLIKEGFSVATSDFTDLMNKKLLEVERVTQIAEAEMDIDAFGNDFNPLEEPMPTVKLAVGFEVSLRTMFEGQPCQERYSRSGNATYPISKETRLELQAALAWLGNADHKGITWTRTDKDEVLFAYPEVIPDEEYSTVSIAGSQEDSEKESFEVVTEKFIKQFKSSKEMGTDSNAVHIQYFILKKIDRARSKVVYSYNASVAELERCCEQWSSGCKNVPEISNVQPYTIFPLKIVKILNTVWKQDGTIASNKFKPIPYYHGMQLLLGEQQQTVHQDLFILMNHVSNLAPYLGKVGIGRERSNESQNLLFRETCKIFVVSGLLLYQLGIRKESYMQEFPYLFGQLLKVSDELHAMYCKVMRNNDQPNTLAGSGLFISGAEQPYRTLAMLGQRMNPYIMWAKKYQTENVEEPMEESWRARWYLRLYERLATQLYASWKCQTRFNEEEKAQYFIGYLAAFPKRTSDEKNEMQEETKNEIGGEENDE